MLAEFQKVPPLRRFLIFCECHHQVPQPRNILSTNNDQYSSTLNAFYFFFFFYFSTNLVWVFSPWCCQKQHPSSLLILRPAPPLLFDCLFIYLFIFFFLLCVFRVRLPSVQQARRLLGSGGPSHKRLIRRAAGSAPPSLLQPDMWCSKRRISLEKSDWQVKTFYQWVMNYTARCGLIVCLWIYWCGRK